MPGAEVPARHQGTSMHKHYSYECSYKKLNLFSLQPPTASVRNPNGSSTWSNSTWAITAGTSKLGNARLVPCSAMQNDRIQNAKESMIATLIEYPQCPRFYSRYQCPFISSPIKSCSKSRILTDDPIVSSIFVCKRSVADGRDWRNHQQYWLHILTIDHHIPATQATAMVWGGSSVSIQWTINQAWPAVRSTNHDQPVNISHHYLD